MHITKRKIIYNSETTTNKKTGHLIISKYFVYFFIILLTCFVLINNLKIKKVAAEDLGKKSLLYHIAQGDEFETEIVENNFNLEDSQPKQILARNENEKFSNVGESALNRNETLDKEIKDTDLYKNQNQNLINDALLKNTSPSTFTTPQPRSKITEYTVKSGDTISSIAQNFNISISTLLWANDLSKNSIIRPGEKITILPTSGVLHIVKSGDTLSAITKRYAVEQKKILDYNNLVSNDQLSIGQKLIIPGGEIKTTYYAKHQAPSISNIFKSPSTHTKPGGFIWPTAATIITQYYHWGHHAIDIAGPIGTPLYASMNGTVVTAGWNPGGYGNYVVIDHGNGYKTLYAHMYKIYVTKGQKVTQGEVIGGMGSTGRSTGPHIHFEIRINGTKVNPLSYL